MIYQEIAETIPPCEDCYPIAKWEMMTDEELQAAGLDPARLPNPPAKTWAVKRPWLTVKCTGCGGILAEVDLEPREEAAIWY